MAGPAERQVAALWESAQSDVAGLQSTRQAFKKPAVPLARVRRILALDDNLLMIARELPVLLAKASELFVAELTVRAEANRQGSGRRVLGLRDVVAAAGQTDMYDFLIDIVPQAPAGAGPAGGPAGGGAAAGAAAQAAAALAAAVDAEADADDIDVDALTQPLVEMLEGADDRTREGLLAALQLLAPSLDLDLDR